MSASQIVGLGLQLTRSAGGHSYELAKEHAIELTGRTFENLQNAPGYVCPKLYLEPANGDDEDEYEEEEEEKKKDEEDEDDDSDDDDDGTIECLSTQLKADSPY